MSPRKTSFSRKPSSPLLHKLDDSRSENSSNQHQLDHATQSLEPLRDVALINDETFNPRSIDKDTQHRSLSAILSEPDYNIYPKDVLVLIALEVTDTTTLLKLRLTNKLFKCIVDDIFANPYYILRVIALRRSQHELTKFRDYLLTIKSFSQQMQKIANKKNMEEIPLIYKLCYLFLYEYEIDLNTFNLSLQYIENTFYEKTLKDSIYTPYHFCIALNLLPPLLAHTLVHNIPSFFKKSPIFHHSKSVSYAFAVFDIKQLNFLDLEQTIYDAEACHYENILKSINSNEIPNALNLIKKVLAGLKAMAIVLNPSSSLSEKAAAIKYASPCYINLGSANLGTIDLSYTDLTHCRLDNINLSGANLANANLSSMILSQVNLNNATLTNAHLSMSVLCHVSLHRASLAKANLAYTEFHQAFTALTEFDDSDLATCFINGKDLLGGPDTPNTFANTNLEGLNWYLIACRPDTEDYNHLANRIEKSPYKPKILWSIAHCLARNAILCSDHTIGIKIIQNALKSRLFRQPNKSRLFFTRQNMTEQGHFLLAEKEKILLQHKPTPTTQASVLNKKS